MSTLIFILPSFEGVERVENCQIYRMATKFSGLKSVRFLCLERTKKICVNEWERIGSVSGVTATKNRKYLACQPLIEMSTRNLPGGKGRPVLIADNLTAICQPIVYRMWEPRSLTTLWATSTR
jgi:hypothetical protein